MQSGDSPPQTLYTLALKVNSLRRELAAAPEDQEIQQALLAAESELASLKDAGGAESSATILNTAATPLLLGLETTGLEAEIKLNMAQVPTSIAHLLDSQENPLVTISLTYPKQAGGNPGDDFKRVRVTSFVEGYSAHSVDTVELRRGAKPTFVRQLPTLFPRALKDMYEMTRATLNVTIEHLDSKELELQTTKNIWLLPRTTAILEMKDPSTGKWKDLSPYLAAYVTPNAPAVMRFLCGARALVPGGRLVGYQGSPEVVDQQVRALFDALKKAEIGYVNSLIAFADQGSATTQRVRLPRESLKNHNANCIDGSVLFASLLEAISLSASLVILSGHAVVGWQAWPNGKWNYLETTKIGTDPYDAARQAGDEIVGHLGKLKNEVLLEEARTKRGITPME